MISHVCDLRVLRTHPLRRQNAGVAAQGARDGKGQTGKWRLIGELRVNGLLPGSEVPKTRAAKCVKTGQKLENMFQSLIVHKIMYPGLDVWLVTQPAGEDGPADKL